MVEELKRAYELLGVTEDMDAGKIEDRYFILLKQHQSKMKHEDEAAQAEEAKRFEEVSNAYKLIKAHLRQQSLENNPIYQADQKKSPFRRKTEHFLSYYKLHVFGGILAIVLIVSIVNSIVNKEKEIPADVSTMLVGAYYADDFIPLESKMTELVPEWKRVKVIVNFTPNESMNQMDPALLQKSMVVLATERPEIYITDQWQFEKLGNQGGFMPLDDWKDQLVALVGEDRLRYMQTPEDTKPKLYGIDLTGSPVFEGIVLDKNDKIFTIRNSEEDVQKAMQLIEAIAKQLKQ